MNDNTYYILQMGTVYLTSYSRFTTDNGWYPVITLDPNILLAYQRGLDEITEIWNVIGGKIIEVTSTYKDVTPTTPPSNLKYGKINVGTALTK